MSHFAEQLIAWQRQHGRQSLPWQNTRDPYRVWLSEIMLQQTQVETVIPYYTRFLQHFPTVNALAAAPIDAVLAQWSGLGYYARARNLHRAAQIIAHDHDGIFPQSSAALAELPGIGRSTAAAIASFCYGERAAILDGNVKRVFARHFGIAGFPGERAVEQSMWSLATTLLPTQGMETYTQALMDLGATLCTRSKPLCLHCPVNISCVARAQGTQSLLPTPKPKRSVPQKTASVLLLRAGASILLELRPPQGIWGGLYSLPEFCGDDDAQAYVAQRFGLALNGTLVELPTVAHSFTHFKLFIKPWLAVLTEQPQSAGEPGLIWAALDDLNTFGLPAPIRRLVGTLS